MFAVRGRAFSWNIITLLLGFTVTILSRFQMNHTQHIPDHNTGITPGAGGYARSSLATDSRSCLNISHQWYTIRLGWAASLNCCVGLWRTSTTLRPSPEILHLLTLGAMSERLNPFGFEHVSHKEWWNTAFAAIINESKTRLRKYNFPRISSGCL